MAGGPAGHRPRKRFGQNFLTDRHVIDRIMQAIDARAEDTIAEIGPGHGALTEPLLRSGARLHVVELDRDLVARWRLHESERFSVHAADALDFDFRALAPPGGGLRAWSATCPTTSRRRCCSTCWSRATACATCISCCSARWSSDSVPNRAAPITVASA